MRASILCFALFASIGCGDSSSDSDAGVLVPPQDASRRDAYVPRDAGRDAFAVRDAGTRFDAGTDAGPMNDAGTDAGPMNDAGTDAGRGVPDFGDPCGSGPDCSSGLCWDYHLRNPFCYGRGCTAPCTSDDECAAYASAAGAPRPGMSFCERSGGECDLFGTGLVVIACE